MFIAITLALWLGIYALRSYVPSAVWNMADELPLAYKPMFAVGTHLIGMLGFLAVKYLRERALNTLVIAFAVVCVARQVFIANDHIGPWLSLLSWVLWLWFMMSLAEEVSAHDAERLIAPALATAVALQVGMQAAWHGLDLQSVRGPIAIGATLLIAAALCVSTIRLPRIQLRRPDASVAWIALGVALFVEVTLVANAGRFSYMTGWRLPVAIAAIQIGAIIAMFVAARVTEFWVRTILIALGFIAVFGVTRFAGSIALLLVAVQVITICAVREGAELRVRWSAVTMFTVGALVYFGLIFAFYNAYELTPLWIVSFAGLSVVAVLTHRSGTPLPRVAMMTSLAAFVLTALYFVPPPQTSAPPARGVGVLSYNIHHGFDDDGVPGMQRTADEIARLDADLIALQEIGRGWTLLGGNDLVSYLAWRFPDYQIFFAATNGQLWGNAVMTRLPLLEASGKTFDAAPREFKYGYVDALVQLERDTTLLISAHLTADLAGPSGDARLTQAQALLQHAMNRMLRQGFRLIVAGDFNAHPEDAPIQHIARHLTDLGAQSGLAQQATWPAGRPTERIDYIFGSGFDVQSGEIPRITTSDHLPVLIRLRDATRRFALSSNRQSSTVSSNQ